MISQLKGNESHDVVVSAIINDLSRYRQFTHIDTGVLGVISERKHESITEWVVLNCIADGHRWSVDREFIGDAMHVRMPCTIQNFNIIDTVTKGLYAEQYNKLALAVQRKHNLKVGTIQDIAHRDAIQLIPEHRYLSGSLNHVTIANNIIESEASLQCIFASDGMFGHLDIHDNTLTTKSVHKITIGGMLSGSVYNNCLTNGDVVKAVLHPLRLGGGKMNIQVISFAAGSRHNYNTIKGDVTDMRTVPKLGTPYVELLDVDVFRQLYHSATFANVERFKRIDRVLRTMHVNNTCIYSESLRKK